MSKKDWWNISESDIPMMEYGNIFLGNKGFFDRGIINDVATFDLVVREIPEDWGYLIFDGLERFVNILNNFKFDDQSIDILKKMNFIDSPEIEKLYREFKFSGDLWAIKDGTIFFPGEPIIRITAPLIEANLLTAFILTAFSYPIRLMSKMARLYESSQGAFVVTDGTARLPGIEQASFSVRDSYIFTGLTPTPLFYKVFSDNIPPQKYFANVNHAVIKSFPTEREAYCYVLDELIKKADHLSVMIDTYEIYKGLEIFIEELKKRSNDNYDKLYLVVDSGNLIEISKHIKKRLREEGYEEIKIQVMSNLNEYLIADFIEQGGEADLLAAATEVINITDHPKLEAVYKIAQTVSLGGQVEYKAKLTEGKESYPGTKQIYRVFENDKMKHDIIGLEGEDLGIPLLMQYVKAGQIVGKFENLEEIRKEVTNNLNNLDLVYKKIKNPERYPIKISEKLINLTKMVKDRHF